MSDRPHRAERGRTRGPGRAFLRVLLTLMFLGVFGTIDLIAYNYETDAQRELAKAPNNPLTWRVVAERFPFSYSACHARARIARHQPDMKPELDQPFARACRAVARAGLAPALRAFGPLTGEATTSAAQRAESANFDALRVGYLAIASTSLSLALSLYLAVAFWRRGAPRWLWRWSLLAFAATLGVVQWWRAIGPAPPWGEPYLAWDHSHAVELLAGCFTALVAFCMWFYRAKPPRRPRPRPAETAEAPPPADPSSGVAQS